MATLCLTMWPKPGSAEDEKIGKQNRMFKNCGVTTKGVISTKRGVERKEIRRQAILGRVITEKVPK